MEDCKPCKTQAKSFVQMRADIALAEKQNLTLGIPVEMLMAVGIKESHGKKYFNEKDAQYKQNLAVLLKRSRLTSEKWHSMIVDKEGPAKGLIPKFRWEESWEDDVTRAIKNLGCDPKYRFILNCSFGYFQKGMIWHLPAKPLGQWDNAIKLMFHSSNEQIRVCANDLDVLLNGAKGDPALAFTRYNGGPSREVVSDYGERVLDLYKHELGINA